jgi:protoheme IX farnesyltransferase
VVAGRHETRRQILIYAFAMAALGVSPWLMGFAGIGYGVLSLAGGIFFVGLAWRLLRVGDGPGGDRLCRQVFGYSILYLFALFAALLVDHGLAWLSGVAGA